MDANRRSNDYRWTNDRHLHFLKSVEASFVRAILEDGVAGRLLRMDRYLPDSCESTLDSKATTTGTKRRKRHFPSDNLDTSTRVRRLHLHQFFPSSQDDQVVPQMKHIKTNNTDKNWSSSPSSSS